VGGRLRVPARADAGRRVRRDPATAAPAAAPARRRRRAGGASHGG
jgi:hypothetical protein